MPTTCPFCVPDELDIFYRGPLVFAAWDRFPVAHGHALIITHRHVASWFEATPAEQAALLEAVEACRAHYNPQAVRRT